MAGFSAWEAIRSSLIWVANLAYNLIAGSRFLHLSLPFLRQQFVYDRERSRFLGLRLRDQTDFNVLRQIFVHHSYDTSMRPDIRATFDAIVAAGRTPLIIDCGANSGMATRYFLDTFPGARGVAIEPDPGNLKLAQENNPGGNVEFRLAGVSSRPGKAALDRGSEGNWGYRTARTEDGDVEMVTINDILDAHRDCVPFLIKIDIEGFESDLFSASTDWVDRFPVIIIELHDWMLPGECNSRNFLQVIAGRNRDFLLRGENVVSISIAQDEPRP